MDTPLLPTWATDQTIKREADALYFEYVTYIKAIYKLADDYAPLLVAESEAMLRHIAEGW